MDRFWSKGCKSCRLVISSHPDLNALDNQPPEQNEKRSYIC
jgi:hypothetical protein